MIKKIMNCSLKNHSLRNLIDNEYLYKLWIKSQKSKGCEDPKIISDDFKKSCFFDAFKKTISLDQLSGWKLKDLVLKIEIMLYQWEEDNKIELISSSKPMSIKNKKIEIDFS